MNRSKNKVFVILLIAVVILGSVYYVNSNKNIKIYASENNIEFFEINSDKLTKDFLNSTEFKEKISGNIEKNIGLNMNHDDEIVINKPVDEIKYMPYQVYLSDGSEKVERISSYYGINDTSLNKTDDGFYVEDFTIENGKATHFFNSYSQTVMLSSHFPNVKVYFVKIDNRYLIFSINA